MKLKDILELNAYDDDPVLLWGKKDAIKLTTALNEKELKPYYNFNVVYLGVNNNAERPTLIIEIDF